VRRRTSVEGEGAVTVQGLAVEGLAVEGEIPPAGAASSVAGASASV